MDGPAQIDACREDLSFKFESSFDISSGVFSPATSDSPQAIFAPLHYEPRYAYPLLVWLHGPGNDHQQLLRIMPLVSLRNYLAVAPQGILTKPQEEYRWDQTTSHIDLAQQRIFDCIETVSRKYNFSRRKIFLAGFDFGGTMALRVAMNSPKRFAGVISLGGAFPMGRKPFGNLNDARHLPIFLAAGRKSKSYSEAHVCSDLRLLHSAGIQVTLRQYPCGQEIAPHMLQDMDRWIIEQITAPAQSLAETDEYK
ncbi:MAG: hypothetical protein JXM70_06255 [Pirellulales bacterium]|nr:hypothetical protein [Pirellulales bacterium]